MRCLIDNDNYDALTISNFKNEKIKSSDTQVCAECLDNIRPGIEFYQASGQFSGDDSDFEEPINYLFIK